MAIPDRFLDELNSRLSIVDVVSAYVPLTRKGGSYWGLCPFHREKTPSFHVDESRNSYHCFGCGKGGGAIRFVMEVENLSFPDAVAKLAGRAGLAVPEDETWQDGGAWQRRKRILDLNREAARFYRAMLSDPRGAAVADYITKKRRICSKFSARFGLGAAPDGWDSLIHAMGERGYDKRELMDAGLAVAGKNGGVYDKFRNRLMLPVIDMRGDVIGFTSRVMDSPGGDSGGPKYLNTPETAVFRKRNVLYGINYAKNTKRSNLILVEGNIDVISMHQAGFDNTIATMGTALTPDHIRLLEKQTRELVLCLDSDSAGEDATLRALGLLKDSSLTVKVLRLPQKRGADGTPGKQDPDDFINTFGGDAMEDQVRGSLGAVEYRLEAARSKYDLAQNEQRLQFLQEANGIVAGLEGSAKREVYAARVAQMAEVSPAAVREDVADRRRHQDRVERKQEERRNLSPARLVQPRERSLRFADTRSARAEEGILRVLLLDPDYFKQVEDLAPEHFSSPVLGRAFQFFRQRWREGKAVSASALDGPEERFTPEERELLISALHGPQDRSTAGRALADCKQIVLGEYQRRQVKSVEDLEKVREALKKRKAYGG